jgi:hypothetical protein
MKRWRRIAIVLTISAMAAWTVLVLGFTAMLVTPAIEGAAESTERARIALVGTWLAGMAVGSATLLGLWRGTFDGTPRERRARWTVASSLAAAVIVGVFLWLGVIGLLIFASIPLAAGLLIMTAWASTPAMRRRLGLAVAGWFIGAVAVVAVWWAGPPGALGDRFFYALIAIAVLSAGWWALPLLRSRSDPQAAAS